MIVYMKRGWFLFCMVLGFLISCKNQADPVQPPKTNPQPVVVTEKPPAPEPAKPIGETQQVTETVHNTPPPAPSNTPAFDPSSISQEEKDTAKNEIQHLIQELNGIIRARNYNAWVSYLDPDYFTVISSAEYLDRISKSTVLVKQKIILKSAQDYFIHVVVPSRTNDRVDDIEFVSQNRVKAYTINNKGERLRLYDLERTENEWKIVN